MTITGTGFSGATAVTFGATAATGFTVNSATQITATAPTGSGTVDVRVTTAGGTSATSAADQFTYVGAPTVTGVSPTSGPASGGTTVTITGTGFAAAPGAGAVKFGATVANYTINSNTQITATAPAGGAGTVDVTVTTVGGTSGISAADRYTYLPAPTVTSISPTAGPTAGGTTVTITGTGFAGAGATSVTFGATAAAGFTVNSATSITATAPSRSAGTVDVRVTTAGGISATSAADQYTYVAAPTVTSISPTVGPVTGGTTVIITGANFSGATAVTFGATAATGYTVNSATQITATAPAGAGTVDVRVTTTGGTSATSVADRFTYQSAPTILISPSALPGWVVGASYSQTIAASGGVAPYSYAVTAGALPAGWTLSPAGALTGTPTAGGTFNFTVTATDSSTGAGAPYSASRAYSLTVAAPTITIAPTTLPAGIMGDAYSQTIAAANGTAPYTFALVAGAMPAGVSLSSAGVLAGTPSVSGTFNFTLSATDSSTGAGPFDGARAYTWTVGAPAPTVTGVSPNRGPNAGGANVTISGTNFTGVTAVTFGGISATSVTVIDATRITATAPAGAGTVDVRVTTASGSSATSAADQFTYVQAPTVTAISPTSGPSTGGTTVTITGANFSGATMVTFGAGAATAFTVNSATQITAIAPAGNGTVDVRVTTTGGTSATSAGDQFTYSSAPIAGAVSAMVAFGSSANPITLNLSGGPASSVAVVSAATNGTATPSGTSIIYTPMVGYFGPDNFTYTATGPGGTSAPATVTVTVATPGAPVVAAASASTAYGAPTAIDLSGSITGIYTSLALASGSAHGVISVSGDVVTYTPAAGYFGADSFTYTATGPGGTSAPATVTVTVATPGAPTVAAVSAAAAYDAPTPIDVSSSISGVHSSVAVVSTPAHGVTIVAGDVITYTPAAGYFGADSFTYTATGPGGTSAPATVTLTVATPVAPTVAAVSAAAVYNASTTIDLSGSITGVRTRLEVASAPVHGVASVSGEVVVYTPKAGYFGADSFAYTATGPGGTSAPATVSLTVAPPPPPVVEQPTGPVIVPPSSGGVSTSVDLGSVSQGPIDGYRITVVSQFGVAEIANGAAAAPMQARASAAPQAAGPYRLIYTPAANFMGEDTVTVVAFGPGGESSPVTFTFQVAGKAPDLSGAVVAGASATFTPTAGLVGGPFQALRVTSPPAFGAVTVNGLSLVFTPGANGGTTTFDYVVDLPFGPSATGRMSLTSNAMPGSEALVAQTLQGVPVTVLLGDVAGGPFTGAAVVSMAPATAGEATIAKVGDDYELTFVSTGDFSGEALVTYSLSNASGTTNSTLTVTVEARPDPSLDPEVRGVATSQVTSARRFADAQINNFQQRLRDLHDGTNGSSNGLSLNLGLGGAEADRDPQQALRRQLGQDRNLDPGSLGGDREREMLGLDLWAGRAQASTPPATSDDRLNAAAQPGVGVGSSVGLWTSGSVDWGRQDATGQRDSRFTTQGATLGLDVKVSDQLIVGGGLGYGEDKTRIGDNGSVTHGKAVTGAFYASWRPAQAFYVDGVFGFANLDFTSRRWVEGLAGQADGYADGDRSGDVRFASAAFGRVLRGERATSDFYARLDARDITLDGFTETGGGLSALNWDEIEQKSLSANLGASWRWTLESRRYGQFRPTARVEWSHELEDIGAQGVRYADWTTSPTYLVPLDAWSRNAINLDLGTEWSLSDRLMLSLGYRGALGDASSSHGAQIGMKYGW